MGFSRGVCQPTAPCKSVQLGWGPIRNWVGHCRRCHEPVFLCWLSPRHQRSPTIQPSWRSPTLRNRTLYLACWNPIRSGSITVFVQKPVLPTPSSPGCLNCLTPLNWLERIFQFKEKAIKQGDSVLVGALDYPV